MPEPALMIWILCAPLVLGIVELVRTLTLIRKTPHAERSVWSQSLGVGRGSQPADMQARPPVQAQAGTQPAAGSRR